MPVYMITTEARLGKLVESSVVCFRITKHLTHGNCKPTQAACLLLCCRHCSEACDDDAVHSHTAAAAHAVPGVQGCDQHTATAGHA